MKIDIVTINGSIDGVIPLHVESPGVGGGELMLITWAKEMTRRGHTIRIFNDPKVRGVYGGVSFLPRDQFSKKEWRDVLISFRGPKPQHVIGANYGISVGWSCDQFEKSYKDEWYPLIDGLVGISKYHRDDHAGRCGVSGDLMTIMEIGVDASEYLPREKNPYQFIWNSVPDRGLMHLAHMWPVISRQFPKAKLMITSDYRLWNNGKDAENEGFKEMFSGMKSVEFLGALPRSELVRIESESEIHLYPCSYEELFCISSAENQVAGVYGITSSLGALPTTNFTGFVSSYHPATDDFKNETMNELVRFYGLSSEVRQKIHTEISIRARARFDWQKICNAWENYFFELMEKVRREGRKEIKYPYKY
jgi:glycosyltransferase involved in cell wall biosynthesis